ncbi:hypothetical protein GWI33_014374 [Rhynchophorus ferrugineus]|uniref:Uncharacterized protein n=1 Tax=Rhynchophorus ferrugineus TaxID=354439 RepID=A0A834M960_RHYFE|nr:hypothetical protein GWI33_014374 [Rhynchophorus ferrugineus]
MFVKVTCLVLVLVAILMPISVQHGEESSKPRVRRQLKRYTRQYYQRPYYSTVEFNQKLPSYIQNRCCLVPCRNVICRKLCPSIVPSVIIPRPGTTYCMYRH